MPGPRYACALLPQAALVSSTPALFPPAYTHRQPKRAASHSKRRTWSPHSLQTRPEGSGFHMFRKEKPTLSRTAIKMPNSYASADNVFEQPGTLSDRPRLPEESDYTGTAALRANADPTLWDYALQTFQAIFHPVSVEHHTVPFTNRKHKCLLDKVFERRMNENAKFIEERKWGRFRLPAENPRYKTIERIMARIHTKFGHLLPQNLEIHLLDSHRSGMPKSYSLGFASGGGTNIYIPTRLWDACRDNDQVVWVIAHELGHCLAKHGLERKMRYEVEGIAPDSEADLAQRRLREFEADWIGRQIAGLCGYHPLAGVALMKRFRDTHGDDNGLGLRTHPSYSARMAAMQAREPIRF